MGQRRLSLFKRFLISGVTLLLLVGGLEGYSRLRAYWDTGNWHFLVWRPGLVYTEYQNNAGFRGPDIEWAKPPRAVRVATLGGSTTYGFGNTMDWETYPRQLEEVLRKEYHPLKVEVLNAGYNHGRSHRVLARTEKVLNLGADILVIYSGYNDYDKGRVPQWGRVTKTIFEAGDYEIQANALERFVHRLSLQSVFFLRLKEKVAKYWYGDINAYYRRKDVETTVTEEIPLTLELREAVDRAVREFVAVYKENLRQVIILARLYGAEVILAKLPIYRQHPGAQHMIESGSLDAINRAVEELAEEYGLPIADVPKAFDGHPRFEDLFNLDWVHLSPEGNGVIARTVAAAIQKAGLLPRPSP